MQVHIMIPSAMEMSFKKNLADGISIDRMVKATKLALTKAWI